MHFLIFLKGISIAQINLTFCLEVSDITFETRRNKLKYFHYFPDTFSQLYGKIL